MADIEANKNDLIPAATVLLLRDDPDFEVLMVERHADISFAGGALVFPGGRIDQGDDDPLWREHADGLSDDPWLARAQVAALREAFEEAGILLARRAGDDEIIGDDLVAQLNQWRVRIEADDTVFLTLIREQKLRLACDRLCLFAHWRPPPRLHKRFDTVFFAARAPRRQTVREDGHETTEAIWIAPHLALMEARDGKRKIIFPTARNLELLGRSAASEDVFNLAASRPIEPVCPVVKEKDGVAMLTIPDHLGYPVTEEPVSTALRG